MIVKDKEKILKRAEGLSSEIIRLIMNESINYNGDPTEQIYLLLHTASRINAKIVMSLIGYGELYGIQEMKSDAIQKWLSKITSEIVETFHGGLSDEIEKLKVARSTDNVKGNK